VSAWRRTVGLARLAAGTGLWLALLCGTALATTLEEAVQRALQTNPDVGAAASDRRAADEQVRQARAGYFPRADIRTAIGREYANTPSTRASAPPWEDDSTNKNRTDAALTVRQMLFDGFETESDVARRQALAESSASRVLQSSEQTGLDAIEAFIETLRIADILAINQENVRTHESYVAALQKRLDRGAGDVGDLRRAQSRLASARGQLIDAEGRMKDVEARYMRIVGEPAGKLDRPAPPEQALPPDVEAAVELGLRANPLTQRAEAELDAARAQSRQSKSGYYPQFDVELNGQTGDNLRGVKGRDTSGNALLVMRYNLTRGGGDMARAQEAIERQSAAVQRLAAARADVERDMRLAWSALRSARARAIAADEQVKADARGRDAFRRQFDLGRARILDLLDSERDYYNSLQLRTSQEATALFGAYRVLQSAGILLRTLKVKPPDEAFGQGDTPWAAEVALTRQGAAPVGPGPTSLPPGMPMRPPPELSRGGIIQPLAPDPPGTVPAPPSPQPGAAPAVPAPAVVQPAAAPAPAPPPPLAAVAPAAGTPLPPLVSPADRPLPPPVAARPVTTPPAVPPPVVYLPVTTLPGSASSPSAPADYAPPLAVTPMPAQVPDRVTPRSFDGAPLQVVPLKIVPVNPS